ncbi:hypothetical protein [Pyrinomonas methylaliphatogenes]|jgi:hypothetical protein|uniref:Uncharacterized protein n=1 Tax=Pyrinomonas methylaliphatogenes TaxID=454194 RepID=A0A0B6WW36_9BACT|nr:hypothetical protein [Pyrinomonas methylaliphatogenes]CDM64962.1 hypothetical protein PYK22_00958 [Pyrinomonas methylaliphatogenes]
MSYWGAVLKRIFFWAYGRTTWQYDVLCLLILAFIFLTPKSWFQSGEPNGPTGHRTITRVVVMADEVGDAPDVRKLEGRLRTVVNRNVEILAVHPARDSRGKIIAYEIDIR